MRSLAFLIVLVLCLLVLATVDASDARFRGAGGTGGTSQGIIAASTDDFVAGTQYDLREQEDHAPSWIVKACYQSDNPTVPSFCFREDLLA